MRIFRTTALDEFYELISVEGGTGVPEFQANLTALFEQPSSVEDLNDHRLSRSRWKKLADEVAPVSRFLWFQGVESGRIRFPLDNHPPDCWLWREGGDNPDQIEVTVAQARERYHLANELVNTGQGRGFIGISDDAPTGD
jgi:hypothetical protein